MSDTVTVSLRVAENDIVKKMLARSKDLSGFLNRVAYPMLIEMQRNRWVTENDGAWRKLNATYQRYKLKRFAAFPGAGTKMMVATSQLYQAVTGDDTKFHRKLVQDNTLTIAVQEESSGSKGRSRGKKKRHEGFSGAEVPAFTYAKYANEQRKFTDIKDTTLDEIKVQLKAYLTGD